MAREDFSVKTTALLEQFNTPNLDCFSNGELYGFEFSVG